MVLISFNFMPAFPLERVAGATALGGLGIPHVQQQYQIVLLASHQDGTMTGLCKVRSVVTSPRSWTTYGSLYRGFSQQDLSFLSIVEHSRHMAKPR